MADDAKFRFKLIQTNCFKDLNIANFICPAVYHGIISSIYWLNPHSSKKRLQDLGTTRKEQGKRKLKVYSQIVKKLDPLCFNRKEGLI